MYGIPPTVAIEQRLSRGGRKSTVGTTTEVWHFLRLLYVKLGTQHCVHDGAAVQPQTPESIAAQLLTQFRGQHIGLLAPLVVNRGRVHRAGRLGPPARLHAPAGGRQLPAHHQLPAHRPLQREHTIELPVASLDVSPENEAHCAPRWPTHSRTARAWCMSSPASAPWLPPWSGAPTAGIGHLQVYSTKRACPVCATSYAELDPRLFSYNSKHGWCPDCVGTGVKLTKDQRKVFDDSVLDDKEKGREQTFAEPEVEDLDGPPSAPPARARA